MDLKITTFICQKFMKTFKKLDSSEKSEMNLRGGKETNLKNSDKSVQKWKILRAPQLLFSPPIIFSISNLQIFFFLKTRFCKEKHHVSLYLMRMSILPQKYPKQLKLQIGFFGPLKSKQMSVCFFGEAGWKLL